MIIEGKIEDIFSPAEVYRDGMRAFNQGKPRNVCPIKHPKARLAFRRGWDRAKEANELNEYERKHPKPFVLKNMCYLSIHGDPVKSYHRNTVEVKQLGTSYVVAAISDCGGWCYYPAQFSDRELAESICGQLREAP